MISQISPEDEWFRVLAESTSAAVLVYRQDHILFANAAAEELTGYSLAELQASADFWQLVAAEHRRPAAERSAARLRGEEVPHRVKFKFRHKSGDERWAEMHADRVRWNGEVANLGTLLDVTQDRRAVEVSSRDQELAQVTLAAIGDGVIRTNAAGRVDYMNPAAERLTGWSQVEAMERDLAEVYPVVNEASRRPRRNPVEQCLTENRTVVTPGLSLLRARNGEEYTIRDSVAPLFGADRRVIGAVVVFRDLTQVRGLERQMVYLASHDTLTGFLNRQELEIYLEVALESARDQGARHALLYLDLWEFRLVNSCYGLVAGDELLRQVAALLQGQLGDRGVLSRVGGDDFAILLEGYGVEAAQEAAREILHACQGFRFSWGGQSFEIGLNVGLVTITAASDSVPQILKAADAACYLAQQSGRNKVHAFVSDDAAVAERYGRLHWVQRIRRSLLEDRFCLYRQEIRPLRDGVQGMQEILVRMVDERGGHVAPGAFIPIAEDHDLAPSLDRWVVRQLLKQLLQGAHPALAAAPVTVNLSGQTLCDDSFLDDVTGYLRASRVDPRRLYFEITETTAVANLARARRFIETLKAMGCRFILDDFGSGFSSFAYLKNLPVDVLKIDGEFVRSMESDPIRRAMVESINQIGQVMGLRTIAEWVETEATYDLLRDLGVDYVQGYWIHRPESLC